MTFAVEIVEVGPRDGLQNEQRLFSVAEKLNLITHALNAGARRIEVASFVHPGRVPQMADAESVIMALDPHSPATYVGLVLNKRGLLRALETRAGGARGVDEVGCVAVASDTFATRNQGQTRAESVQICKDMIRLAKQEGLAAQVTITTAFGCPFEGRIAVHTVLDMVKDLAEADPKEIALADTIGVAVPPKVTELLHQAKEVAPHIPLRAHFHNTRNTGIANAWAAYQAGANVLDASLGGLGGCPFAPNATGNIATEDLVYMLQEADIGTGLSLNRLIEGARWLEKTMARQLPAMVSRAGGFPEGTPPESS